MSTKAPMPTICLVALMLGLAPDANAGTKIYLGNPIAVDKRISIDQIDHRPWGQLLQIYVDAEGRVDYQAWKRSAQASQALDAYLNSLSRASRSAPARRESQLAFWINAYNAATIKGILREYPTSSIRNHTAKVFGYNIWRDLLLTVGDDAVSLDDIEHKILRKMKEPRIHFAIVCASQGCPPLLNDAYTADRLDEQLTANSKAFFAKDANFIYDANRRSFKLSAILNWFGEDFGGDQAAQLKAIAPYLPSQAARAAALRNEATVSFLDYDWNLNDQ